MAEQNANQAAALKKKKARPKSLVKTIRRNQERNLRNKSFRAETKTKIRKLLVLLSKEGKEKAKEALPKVISAVYKARSKGVFKKNTAARLVSSITKKINAAK
jgi:small subunit ribosomal protein S20